jgi:cytochrome c553
MPLPLYYDLATPLEALMQNVNRLLLVVALAALLPTGVKSQQAGDRSWAFPLKPERGFPEETAPKTLPGSAKQYTQAQVDELLNPPDWYPDRHPPAPQIVLKGHGAALACGACHLMSGLGHPESSDLTGLSADYIVQQMAEFKSRARKEPTRMNGIAAEVSEEEARQAAEWFARLPRRSFTQVVEADTVPKTFLGPGRMRFAEPDGSTELIGSRIITVPEDQERARLRDPSSGFIAYVPVGSLARGRELVETGGGITVPCGQCHGRAMQGHDKAPRLAGMHPIYTVRQLYGFKDGSRNGADAGPMKPLVRQLTDEDILALSAYLAALSPYTPY